MNKSNYLNKNLLTTAAIAFCLFLNTTIIKAQLILPQASPKASVSQTVGITDIKIDYHKPSVKGRVIWGDVVPYDSVWRTGANEATTISFSSDVFIEGKLLVKGKYALYSIPGKTDWTIIFNKKRDMQGSYNYDKTTDVLRLTVKPLANDFTETMVFHICDVALESCTINLDWEKLRLPIKVRIETDSMYMAYIRDFIHAEPDDAATYRAGASYTLMSGLHQDIGVQWAEMAINYRPDYEAYWLRGNLRAKLGKYDEAIEDLIKGLEAAKRDKDYVFIKPEFEKAIAEIKTKKGNR